MLSTEVKSLFSIFIFDHSIERRNRDATPKAGGAATIFFGTDRYAATIVRATKCMVVAREDISIRVDGSGASGVQKYRHKRDRNGIVRKFRKTKNGWRYKGLDGVMYLTVGERDRYHDYDA